MSARENEVAKKHLDGVIAAKLKMQAAIGSLTETVDGALADPGNEILLNQVSEILGEIHQLGENAMNDYRVNRKVARVERLWRAEFDKREKSP